MHLSIVRFLWSSKFNLYWHQDYHLATMEDQITQPVQKYVIFVFPTFTIFCHTNNSQD